jgi:hypothetical protein
MSSSSFYSMKNLCWWSHNYKRILVCNYAVLHKMIQCLSIGMLTWSQAPYWLKGNWVSYYTCELWPAWRLLVAKITEEFAEFEPEAVMHLNLLNAVNREACNEELCNFEPWSRTFLSWAQTAGPLCAAPMMLEVACSSSAAIDVTLEIEIVSDAFKPLFFGDEQTVMSRQFDSCAFIACNYASAVNTREQTLLHFRFIRLVSSCSTVGPQWTSTHQCSVKDGW